MDLTYVGGIVKSNPLENSGGKKRKSPGRHGSPGLPDVG
jgi:hypothetical protein